MNWKPRLKYLIKIILAYLCYYTGILYLYRLVYLKDKAVVLMYHRVLPTSEIKKNFSHSGIVVSESTFEKHLKFLKRHFSVLTLDQFIEQMNHRLSFEKNACLITFDDGWKDNSTYAYPLLRKYNLPAVIFLPTNFIGTGKQFWQERLARILLNMHHSMKKVPANLPRYMKVLEKYDLQSFLHVPDSRLRGSINGIIEHVKKRSEDVERLISDIHAVIKEDAEGTDESEVSFLDWTEVKRLAGDGIAIGSHGVTHRILTRISVDEAMHEVGGSKKVIEEKLRQQISAFCYPNGNYNGRIIDVVKTNNYDIAFCTESGLVSHSDDPYRIKRQSIFNDVAKNIPMFMMRTLGWL